MCPIGGKLDATTEVYIQTGHVVVVLPLVLLLLQYKRSLEVRSDRNECLDRDVLLVVISGLLHLLRAYGRKRLDARELQRSSHFMRMCDRGSYSSGVVRGNGLL